MRKKMYFCRVKSVVRYIAAATMQRFLCPSILFKYSRSECGRSNARKVFALQNLTAPAAFLLSNSKL